MKRRSETRRRASKFESAIAMSPTHMGAPEHVGQREMRTGADQAVAAEAVYLEQHWPDIGRVDRDDRIGPHRALTPTLDAVSRQIAMWRSGCSGASPDSCGMRGRIYYR